VSDAIVALARSLATQHLRTLDAVHLATSIHAGAAAMAVYDERLAEAAAAHGIAMIAPRA
jgi:predicted nucleic acid-binding protein